MLNNLAKVLVSFIVLLVISAFLGGYLTWYITKLPGEPPWNAVWLLWKYGEIVHKSWLLKSSLGIAGGLCVLFALAAIKIFIRRRGMVYGRARLANLLDVRKAGLLKSNKGIFLGYFGSRPLFDNTQQHVCLIAESGTGKGVSLIIPNLFLWSGSVIVSDMKGENHRYTSGYRQSRGQACYSFDPFNAATHRINPLTYFSDDNPIDHLQNMGYVVYPDPQSGEKIWSSNARQLFIGLALLLYLERGREAVTFANIIATHTMLNFKELDKRMTAIQPHSFLVDTCWQILKKHADTPDKTRGGFDAEFRARLDIFLNPAVAWATSANDVPLERLRKDPISLYLTTSPGDIERVSFIMRMIQETVKMLHTKEEFSANPEHQFQILLLNDEQHNVYGNMPLMLKAASFYRSYGIRIFSVYQSLAQIKMDYGADGAMAYLDNHNIRIHYCPTDQRKAKEFAAEIGETTIFTTSRSTGAKGNNSKSEAPQKREAFLPEELVKMLGNKHGLLFVGGSPPIKFRKAVWHDEKVFKERQLPPAEVPIATPEMLHAFQAQNGKHFQSRLVERDPAKKLANMVKNNDDPKKIMAAIDAMILEETTKE